MSERGSVISIESLLSDGCPFTESLLHDQQDIVIETLKRTPNRNALTQYNTGKSKMIVGKGCRKHDVKKEYPRSRTFRHRTNQSTQEMIFTCMSMQTGFGTHPFHPI